MDEIVGIVGLGNMGSCFAGRLSSLGFKVFGHDKASKRIDGVITTDLKYLVENSSVILLSLPNSLIIESLLLGIDGILSYIAPSKTVIDLSSASPVSTNRIYESFKSKGAFYLDAAVSGGAAKAANGTITVMVGGDQIVFEKNHNILNHIGGVVHYMGKSGTGDAMKAINNFLTAAALAATGEAMIVGKKLGLNPSKMLEVLNQSSGESYATRYRFPKIVKGDYIEDSLSFNMLIKDIEIYRECAQNHKVPTLIGDFIASIFRLGVGIGKGDLVANHLPDVLGDLAGGVRLSDKQ
jgi:3-hydroxyisobutyrate dehydrogenase